MFVNNPFGVKRSRLYAALRPSYLAIAALLVVVALGVAACSDQPTAGPIGPQPAAPTATAGPTETAVPVTGAGAETYRQTQGAMRQLTSYHFVSDTDLGKAATQHIEGDWAAPNRIRMTVTNKGGGFDGTQQIVRIGAEEWTRPNETTNWSAVSNAPAVVTGPDQVDGILRYAQSVDQGADVTLDGQAAHHLTFTLDQAKLAADTNIGLAKGEGELWVDTATSHILQVKLTFTSSVQAARGSATTTMKFSDFNKAVDIPHP
jgi:outer membrane lipoprotein-sorting protein